jgi:MFS family permease
VSYAAGSLVDGEWDSDAAASLGSGRNRALALLALVLVLSMTTWFSASAVIPQLREEWGLGGTAGAWLTIAVQLGFVLGALLSAAFNLADIYSPRHLILVCSLAAAAANALIGYAQGPEGATILRFLTGFFLAGVYPPALKLLSTWFVRGRGVALGVLVGALTVGSAVPHLVNGFGGLDWRLVIWVTSIMTVVGGGLAELGVREGPFPFPRAVLDPRQTRVVLANRGVALAVLGYFGHQWELYAMWTWFVVFFAASLEAAGRDAGSLPAFATFLVIGMGGIGCWVGGILGDSWGRARTTVLMMAVSGSCSVLIGFVFGRSPWLVLALGLVWGFTIVADSAQFSTVVTEFADPAYVGTALTLQTAIGFALTVATIWLVPFAQQLVGWRWAFAVLAPGPALGSLAMLRLLRSPETVTATAEAGAQ